MDKLTRLDLTLALRKLPEADKQFVQACAANLSDRLGLSHIDALELLAKIGILIGGTVT